MIPGMNPKMLEKAMKQPGMKQEHIDAKEVIIKQENKDLILKNQRYTLSKIYMPLKCCICNSPAQSL